MTSAPALEIRPPGPTARLTEELVSAQDFDVLRRLYEDLHRHPELAMEEHATADRVATSLSAAGLAVTTHVGGTGVVAMLHNRSGPVLLLRADMDGLPLVERTGLPYASTDTTTDAGGRRVGLMHACGHDLHMASLVGAANALAAARHEWRGSLMVVAQPGEETAQGAVAMLKDGLYDRFGHPDLALAQHAEAFGVDEVAHRSGLFSSGALSLDVRIRGRGGHASSPDLCVDPVLVAAAIVTRVHGIAEHEYPPTDPVVATVTAVHAGSAANVIPDEARLTMNLRFGSADVGRRLVASVTRAVEAECAAAGCPEGPTISEFASFPVMINDEPVVDAVSAVHQELFGEHRVAARAVSMGSEDFPAFSGPEGVGRRIPSCYWMFGSLDRRAAESADTASAARSTSPAGPHSDTFAPFAHGALRTGVRAMVGAALTFLPPRL